MLLDEKMVAIAKAFAHAGIPYAFGGANALAYYAQPRATADLDINVFVSEEEAQPVLDVLGALGAETSQKNLHEKVAQDGQLRVMWGATPLDLFFSYDDLHKSSMVRIRTVPFGEDSIRILSAEDLMIYKAIFNRPKDWRDISEMVFAANDPIDFDYVKDWLSKIDTPNVDRLGKLEVCIRSGGQEPVD